MIRSLPGPGFFRPTGVIHLFFSPLSIRATAPGGRRVGNAISTVHNTRVSPRAMSAMPPNDGASVLKPALRTTTDGEANEPSSLKGQYPRGFFVLLFFPGKTAPLPADSHSVSARCQRSTCASTRPVLMLRPGQFNLHCRCYHGALHASVPCQWVRVRSSDRN